MAMTRCNEREKEAAQAMETMASFPRVSKAARAREAMASLPPVYKDASIADLFVNQNLRSDNACTVLQHDPFCIPRSSDNVQVYYPSHNPHRILMDEEKLLPQNFRLDPREGVPDAPPDNQLFMGSLPRQNDRKRSIEATDNIPFPSFPSPLVNYLRPDDPKPISPSVDVKSESYEPTLSFDISSEVSSPSTSSAVEDKLTGRHNSRRCTHPGCTKGARGKLGLCQRHGGGRRCITKGCDKGAQGSSSYCLLHGGGYRCKYPGCNTGARGATGLCAKHGGKRRKTKA